MNKKIKIVNDPANSKNFIEVAEKAQKENMNLDLQYYEPFMKEF